MSQNAFQLGVTPYNAIPEKWSKVLLKNLSLIGVYRHIAVDHSSELSDNADTLNLRVVDDSDIAVTDYYTYSSGSTTAGTEGTIDYADAKVNKIVLALNKTPSVAISFEDYALKFTDVDFQARLIDRAKYKVAQLVDTTVMNAIIAAVPSTNKVAAFDATAATEGEMYDILLQMAAILKKNGATTLANPSDLFGDKGMTGVPYVVVNPDVMRYILKEPAFVKVDFNNQSAAWKDGTVRGTIAGLKVLESSNLATTANKVTIFGGIKDATHYAVKMVTTRLIAQENKYRMLWSTLYAIGAVVSEPKALTSCEITVAA